MTNHAKLSWHNLSNPTKEYLQKKKNLFISWNRAEKQANVLKNKVVKNLEQKFWINSKTMNSAFVWCEVLQISEPVIHLGRYNILLNLHDSSQHT